MQEHEEKGRQRRPGGALKEEDKERKKKELSLKIVYSSQSKYSKKQSIENKRSKKLEGRF